jgi:CheY-like chemotaxis protein
MMGTHQDITKNKETEERITRINSAKSMYLTRLSHEIRTPLSAMIGMLDLSIITDDEAERDDYLANARQSSSHLISLINDVLDYSKIEAGALQLETVPFNPLKELKSVISIFKQVCNNKKISLQFTENLKLKYKVYGDPTRFRQILINLAGNAVKFTERGRVEIGAGFLFDSYTLSNFNTVNLYVTIKDTGPGIPPDRIDQIFDNFIQADKTISAKYGGTGLGLAITKELVEMMGGTIRAESTPGQGSIFMLDIPFKVSEELNKNGDNTDLIIKRTDTGLKNKAYSILVADDDPINLKLVTTLLKKHGHHVSSASNGEVVIEMLSKHNFDAAIIDIEMPAMDGIETAKRIRAGEAGEEKATVSIIGLTAYSYNDIMARCAGSGIDRIISKPVRTGFFNNTIIEVIEINKK